MTYNETPIWSSARDDAAKAMNDKKIWFTMLSKNKPTASVDLFVYRANLLGNPVMGELSLFHTGLAFRSGSDTWVLDIYASKTLQDAVIPTIADKNGKPTVSVDGSITIGLYESKDILQWQSYWNADLRSDAICTISPDQYLETIDYIFGDFANSIKSYSLFTLQSLPNQYQDFDTDSMSSSTKVYTNDLTCDSLPFSCFRFLNSKFSVDMKQTFPLLRVVVRCKKEPTRITDPTDPELIDFVKKIQQYMVYEQQVATKDYGDLLSELTPAIQAFLNQQFKDDITAKLAIQAIMKQINDLLKGKKSPFSMQSRASLVGPQAHALARASSYNSMAQLHSSSSESTPLFFYSLDTKTGEPFFYRILAKDFFMYPENGLYRLSADSEFNYNIVFYSIITMLVLLIIVMAMRQR